jgi:hypothetical protein
MRRHSLRLLTTPPIPVPPSLKTSPYLTTSTIFSCGLASPTLPSEEDEKWLQDTIPIPSRHHVQLASASSHSTGLSLHSGSMARNAGEDNSPRSAVTGGVLSTQKSTDASGSLHPEHHHHHRRHLSASESARDSLVGVRTRSEFEERRLPVCSVGQAEMEYRPASASSPRKRIFLVWELIR